MTQLKTPFGKVAVLLGGHSAERDVSLKSGQAVLNALKGAGVDAIAFDPKEQPLWQLKDLGIELSTAPYAVVDSKRGFDTKAIMSDLKKVMVKPSHEGSSIGMAQANNAQELEAALTEAFKFDNQVLVEQWITGREFTVTVLGNDVQPVIEMTTPNGFYDYQAKYQSTTTQYHCPADLSVAQTKLLQDMALQAFDLVGASGWGRVDAMQDEQGDFYLLEVNTVPGMTEKSLVPMAAKANGATFEQLVVRILEQTL